MTREQEQRLLQLVAQCVLWGSGNMAPAAKEEMKFLCMQHGVQKQYPNHNRYCACGCGELCSKPTNKYVKGHSHKDKVA
jgi:hypothetical protein